MSPSPLADREQTLAHLAAEPLDVLVVGGGIVGAGVARDAAMRGLRVGLAEQLDMAFGTSSRSSRLLHGGLRYLAQGRLGLVYEASREKKVLHQIAPHLCGPLAFVFPTYRGSGWPWWQMAVGVKLYDLLCGGRNLGPSSAFGAATTMKRLPGLGSDRLSGGVCYFDGFTNDARLVVDTLRSARTRGAMPVNYLRLDEARAVGQMWECRLTDVLTGRALEVRARTVVNATGPWSDRLPQSAIRLRVTKGVHLVLDHARLPIPDAMAITEGNRILFGLRWGQRTVLGSTDTDYHDALEDIRTDSSDIEYVLGVTNQYFPDAKLTPADVKACWAGVRPLIADPNGHPSDISRRHEIIMSHPGWIDVAGGKLTTYRLIAEQVVDRLFRHLGRPSPRCTTAQELIVEPSQVPHSRILPPEVDAAVVREACQAEWAVHLDDVMIRRTSWHYYRDDRSTIAAQVADWMGQVLAWDPATREAELVRYAEKQ
jgi:glycerol-3-phosphate dehydrogenase